MQGAQWADISALTVKDGRLALKSGNEAVSLANESQFAGYRGDPASPTAILLIKNGLHVEVVINADHPIGTTDKAHIADVLLEFARNNDLGLRRLLSRQWMRRIRSLSIAIGSA